MLFKLACSKYRESQRLAEEGKISGQDLDGIKNRLDVISAATMAEINQFERERLIDYRRMMKRFLDQQINFYQQIVTRLQTASEKFSDIDSA